MKILQSESYQYIRVNLKNIFQTLQQPHMVKESENNNKTKWNFWSTWVNLKYIFLPDSNQKVAQEGKEKLKMTLDYH